MLGFKKKVDIFMWGTSILAAGFIKKFQLSLPETAGGDVEGLCKGDQAEHSGCAGGQNRGRS